MNAMLPATSGPTARYPKGVGIKQMEKYLRAIARSRHREPDADLRFSAMLNENGEKVPIVFQWKRDGKFLAPVVSL